MPLSHEEITAIKKEVLAEVDKQYVSIYDCSDRQKSVNGKLANDNTRITLFEQKLKSWEWIFKLIATGTVGTLITSILSLVIQTP